MFLCKICKFYFRQLFERTALLSFSGCKCRDFFLSCKFYPIFFQTLFRIHSAANAQAIDKQSYNPKYKTVHFSKIAGKEQPADGRNPNGEKSGNGQRTGNYTASFAFLRFDNRHTKPKNTRFFTFLSYLSYCNLSRFMQLKNKMIQKIDRQSDFVVPAKLLNETFATVAKEFGPTKENSPANNAFITCEELKSQINRKQEIPHLQRA